MLSNLRIKNFRMLEDLEIPKLGRVNLIVGKNNSGKSTILEALRIYAGRAHPNLLREILLDHDESFDFERDAANETLDRYWYGLKHLFPNRQFPADSENYISISSDTKPLLKIEHIFYHIEEDIETDEDGAIVGRSRRRIFISDIKEIDDEIEPIPAIRITFESGRTALLDLTDDMRRVNQTIGWRGDDAISLNCSNVSTEFLASDLLAKLWDQITLGPSEDVVLSALRVIDNNLDRLNFVQDPNKTFNRDSNRLAIVTLKGSTERIPLNSMGDGMSRILQLILSVFPAKDGVLLIDEFENGLHFSVQEEVWKIIFKLAKELNIQVFATTHSWDCIESFTKAAIESPEEGVLLKVSKSRLTSDNGRVVATIYDEKELGTITASDLEVR